MTTTDSEAAGRPGAVDPLMHADPATLAHEAARYGGTTRAGAPEMLFRPVEVAGLRLPNRFMMAPMTRCFAPGGVPVAEAIAYYRRRAEAEVGFIVTEGIGVDHPAALGRGTLGEDNLPVLHDAEPGRRWREIVDAIHGAGGLVAPQLWHMGPVRQPGTGLYPDWEGCRPSGLWGPAEGRVSALPDYLAAVRPETRPMTESEIGDVIDAFGRSARRAAALGVDAIAIHGAHGYLLDSFLWNETNHRSDKWGGSIEGRVRLSREVVRTVRQAAPTLPIIFRFSQWKLQDYDGRIAAGPDELGQILCPLADAGVSIFDASTRDFAAPAFAGEGLTLAGWARRLTGRPTIAGGGISLGGELRTSFTGEVIRATDRLEQAARMIQEGECDLLAIGRSLVVEPAWVRRQREGEPVQDFRLAALASLA